MIWEVTAALFLLAAIVGWIVARVARTGATFRLVVEASPSAMVLVDSDGRITLVNAQTERLFGYARGELLGESVELLVPPQFNASHSSSRASFLAAPRARAMGAGRDLHARRKDGLEIPVEIGLNPIKTARRTLTLAAITDIRKRLYVEALRLETVAH